MREKPNVMPAIEVEHLVKRFPRTQRLPGTHGYAGHRNRSDGLHCPDEFGSGPDVKHNSPDSVVSVGLCPGTFAVDVYGSNLLSLGIA